MGFRSSRLASIAFPVLGSQILGSQILGSPVPDLRCAASGMMKREVCEGRHM